jgi:hypothetical protein
VLFGSRTQAGGHFTERGEGDVRRVAADLLGQRHGVAHFLLVLRDALAVFRRERHPAVVDEQRPWRMTIALGVPVLLDRA